MVMPVFDTFDSAEFAYGTLAHRTGHETRLSRTYDHRFANRADAAEELVAELSAAITCALLDIDTATRQDRASYLAHWCHMLREDPSILWTVASRAQAATGYLAAFHQSPEPSAP